MAQESGEILKMKQDAISHAREMQRRARSAPPPPLPECEATPLCQNQDNAPISNGLLSFLDDDGILILLLIFILSKERADPKLILALLYVLL